MVGFSSGPQDSHVNVLGNDLPALFLGKLPKLQKLILSVLLQCAYPAVDCDSHAFFFRGLPPFRPFFRAARALASDLDDPPLRPMPASHLRAALGIMRFIIPSRLGYSNSIESGF